MINCSIVFVVNLEKNPNQLFTVPPPLAGQRGAADVEECRLESCCYCLCQHRLACARRTKEQEAADWVWKHASVSQGGKDVGEAEGQGDTIMEWLLGLKNILFTWETSGVITSAWPMTASQVTSGPAATTSFASHATSSLVGETDEWASAEALVFILVHYIVILHIINNSLPIQLVPKFRTIWRTVPSSYGLHI